MATPRIALVTGASRGIGNRCALLLSQHGWRVYGASRTVTPGSFSLQMDVTSDASVRDAVDTILHQEGRLDAVVNNAGSAIAGAIEDTSVEEAHQQFEVNFYGVLRVCRAALPAMRRQRSGVIINIGSIAGLIAVPYQGLYSASKFALEGLTEALRLEVRPFGVRVILVEPGDHPTSFTENRRLTAAARGDSPYRNRMESAVQRMALDEQNGPDPARVARLVDKILNTSRPRLRYTTGPPSQRIAVWMKRMFPYCIVEKVIAAYYS